VYDTECLTEVVLLNKKEEFALKIQNEGTQQSLSNCSKTTGCLRETLNVIKKLRSPWFPFGRAKTLILFLGLLTFTSERYRCYGWMFVTVYGETGEKKRNMKPCYRLKAKCEYLSDRLMVA
jgi:hypothetical protein